MNRVITSEDVIKTIRTNPLKVIISVYSLVVSPLLYYGISYIDLIRNNLLHIFFLISFETVLTVLTFYIAHHAADRKILGFLKSGRPDLSEEGEVKKSAYHYPLYSAFVFVFSWLVLANGAIFIPVLILRGGRIIDLVLVNFLLFSGALMSTPIAYFVSEKTSAGILNLEEVRKLKEPGKCLRLSLTVKILMVCLSIILSLVLNMIGAIAISTFYNLSQAQTVGNLLIVGAQGFLATIVISILFARSIKKPIQNMKDCIVNLNEKEGDLSLVLPRLATDELGDVSSLFNTFLGKLRTMIVTIKKQAGILSGVGVELSADMAETAASINQIGANIHRIKNQTINQSASVTETNATMNTIIQSITKLTELIEQQSVNVTESSSAIEEMLANIGSVTQTLVKSTADIDALSAASAGGRKDLNEMTADIRKVAEESAGLLEISTVIQGIAGQTNLLAMNAAIEAAHAGASGKGFAVVADEVRKLAESSGQQAKTVSSVLKNIKGSVDRITRSTGQVLLKFESIETGVRTVSEQEAAIRNAMEEQTHGSRQVLEAISRLNDITREVKSGSLEMLNGSNEVIEEGKNLSRITGEITSGMNEMSSGAQQITVAVNRVSDISRNNSQSIDALVAEVGKFKVD